MRDRDLQLMKLLHEKENSDSFGLGARRQEREENMDWLDEFNANQRLANEKNKVSIEEDRLRRLSKLIPAKAENSGRGKVEALALMDEVLGPMEQPDEFINRPLKTGETYDPKTDLLIDAEGPGESVIRRKDRNPEFDAWQAERMRRADEGMKMFANPVERKPPSLGLIGKIADTESAITDAKVKLAEAIRDTPDAADSLRAEYAAKIAQLQKNKQMYSGLVSPPEQAEPEAQGLPPTIQMLAESASGLPPILPSAPPQKRWQDL